MFNIFFFAKSLFIFKPENLDFTTKLLHSLDNRCHMLYRNPQLQFFYKDMW